MLNVGEHLRSSRANENPSKFYRKNEMLLVTRPYHMIMLTIRSPHIAVSVQIRALLRINMYLREPVSGQDDPRLTPTFAAPPGLRTSGPGKSLGTSLDPHFALRTSSLV